MLSILLGGVLGAAISRRLRPQDRAMQASATANGLLLGFLVSCVLTTLVPGSSKNEVQVLTRYSFSGRPSVLVRKENGRTLYLVCLRSYLISDEDSCEPATFVAGRDANYVYENSRNYGVLITTTVKRDTNSPLARWLAIPHLEKPVVTRTILAPLESLGVGVDYATPSNAGHLQ